MLVAAAIVVLALAALLLLAFTDVYGPYYADGGETIGPPTLAPQLTGDSRAQLDFTIPASTPDQEQQIGFDVANLKGLLITVSGNTGGTVVLETNSTSVPGTTLTFPAGGGELVWSARSPLANPFGSTDVTTTFWSNNAAAQVTVKVRALFNS